MVRLIAAAILVLSSAGAANGADVCDRIDEPTEGDLFKYADEVFHALVVRTALSDERLRQIQRERLLVEVWYEIKEVLKGDPAPNEPVVTTKYVMRGCGLNILAGQEYVFYTTFVPFGANNSKRYVDIIGGTRGLPVRPEFIERRIEQIREISRALEELSWPD
jgi:hypothetical protein